MPITNQWDKEGEATLHNRRVKMLVHFEQSREGQIVTTKLEVTVTRLQKRIFCCWFTTSAIWLKTTGAFSGPRSPVNPGYNPGTLTFSPPFQNGQDPFTSGPNPFVKGVMFNEKVTHFVDQSSVSDPLFTIDNGKYSVEANFSPQTFGPTAVVQW